MPDTEKLFGAPPEPEPTVYRYHCQVCGRFVPFSTVRTFDDRPDYELRSVGKCGQDDVVEVTWGQP
jgi:hypothetical protein